MGGRGGMGACPQLLLGSVGSLTHAVELIISLQGAEGKAHSQGTLGLWGQAPGRRERVWQKLEPAVAGGAVALGTRQWQPPKV